MQTIFTNFQTVILLKDSERSTPSIAAIDFQSGFIQLVA
jgi:hypothetical protein